LTNHPLWGNDTDWNVDPDSVLIHTIDLWGNPGFINPTLLDYHIGLNSMALDHAISSSLLTDIDGQKRPSGIAPDLGADEYFYITPLNVSVFGPVSGYLNTEYTFTATVEPISVTKPLQYIWQASGYSTITHTNGLTDTISYLWNDLGTHVVTVTASNPAGSATNTKTIYITDQPITELSASNNGPIHLGETAILTAEVETGSNINYKWNYGNGGSGYGAIVTYTYPAVGVYTALVTASNSTNVLTTTTIITVTDVPIYGLTGISDSPTNLGQPTTLTATLTAGSNVSYTWDFGDGSALSFGATVTHTYEETWEYSATVTASNSEGSVQDTVIVVVVAIPRLIYLPLIQK
jgi:PKD repeat protein